MFQLQFDRYEPVWRWKKYSYTSATQLSAAYTVSLARYLSAFFFLPRCYWHRWLIYSGIQAREERAYYATKIGKM